MKLIDKVISNVSPIHGLKRLKARTELQKYEKANNNFVSYSNYGASRIKKTLKGWVTKVLGPDRDIGDNKVLLTERSRDLTMGGSSIALGAIKKIRTNVVGEGLKFKSTIDSDFLGILPEEKRKIERHIERVWELWASSKNCDMSKQNNFYQLTSLALFSHLQNGDCFAMLPYKLRPGDFFGTKVQLIESDRCKSPLNAETSWKIRNGVEINEDGEITAYYFANKHPGDYAYWVDQNIVRVEAYGKYTGKPNVLCLMDRERIGQRRGIPLVSAVIEDIKQLGRYTEAELMSAVINAYFTVFIENEKEETQSGFGAEVVGEDDEVDEDDESSYELGMGTVVELAPGQKANSPTPGRPNPQFDFFVNAMCKQIGTALEIPFEVLLNNFNSSYSASRAALLEVWKMYRTRRANIVTDFCEPVKEQVIDEAVAKGYIEAPGYFKNPLIRAAYLKCEWHGPSQGQLDPLKEVKASVLKTQSTLSTKSREARELNGSDWESNVAQRKIEEEEELKLPNAKATEDINV